jgi:hypothetical protein
MDLALSEKIATPTLRAIEATCKQIVIGIDFPNSFLKFEIKSKELGYVN